MDGITLLRYAHIYRNRTSGGAEQYLRQINDGLLAKNRMTILQMHLVPGDSPCSAIQVEVEKRGQGQIIWIPVSFYTEERSLWSLPHRMRVLGASRNTLISRGERSAHSYGRFVFGNLCGHLRYSTMILSEVLVDVLNEYRVDLIIFHWLSYDVETLVSCAARRHIPYAIIHHFDNGRLSMAYARQLAKNAAVVGGVSNRNVPSELKDRYINLSDAVDVNFFSAPQAKPVPYPDSFVVLLPGRIVPGKGHADLLLAAKSLVEVGANTLIVFAGAVESEPLVAELKKKVIQWGLDDRVVFLGELTPEGLRDWYGRSDVVVLPSNSEGLGRVLLEAQAMGKPVIAYDTGGMPEALVANKTGFLIGSGDYAGLEERIKYLIYHPTERTAMGKSGREFVLECYSPSGLFHRHELFCCKGLSRVT